MTAVQARYETTMDRRPVFSPLVPPYSQSPWKGPGWDLDRSHLPPCRLLVWNRVANSRERLKKAECAKQEMRVFSP